MRRTILCFCLPLLMSCALLPWAKPSAELASEASDLTDNGDRAEKRPPYDDKPAVTAAEPTPQSAQDMEPCKSFRATVAETGGPCALEQGAVKECTPQTCPNCAKYVPAYASAGQIPGCL